MSTRIVRGIFIALCIVSLIPALASAQSLAGAVRDTSGAVLPGVTVEASSPALITKVRTSVTDDAGQYRIPDLPPGTYKITFSLTGFTTVVREGVELTGGGVMTIGADMQVGSLQESITVTGESPVVDVQTCASAAGHQRRRHPRAAGVARLRQLRRGRSRPSGHRLRRRRAAHHQFLLRARRPQQRGH